MKLKWLDALLIAATIVGGLSYVRVQAELVDLHRQQARIEAAVGHMEISDSKSMHIKALDTQEPWQWAWRVYLPDSTNGKMSYRIGSTGSSGSLGFGYAQQEFIARISLSDLKDGRFGFYSRVMGASSFSSFGSKEFCDFLREHRSELVIEQCGQAEVAQLNAGDPPVVFFRLTMPERLVQLARQKFADSNSALIPQIIEVSLELP